MRKEVNEMKKDFNDFRFSGLNYRDQSNKYFTMERVNADETKIVVRVGESHLLQTKYGYALILDCSHVVFLKNWQVSCNYFGNEVLLDKKYFEVKEWGEHYDFGENAENLEWETWLNAAKEQSQVDEDGFKITPVKWEK